MKLDIKKSFLIKIDYVLLVVVLMITTLGITMIGSAGGWRFDISNFTIGPIMTKQMIGLGIGLGLALILMLMRHELLKFLSFPAYPLMLILLLAVLVIGVGTSDAGEEEDVRRWIPFIGGFNLQPSEFAKFLMILVLARFCDLRKEKINRFSTIALLGALVLVPVFLIYKEPDLSTSIVLVFICAAMIFAAGIDRKLVILALVVVGLAVWIIISDAYNPDGPKILSEYQATRIWAFFEPENYTQDYAYQTLRSQYALSSGGLQGVGLFNGGNLVPVPMTDFIFGILGEELGFLGASIYMILLVILVIRIFWIAGKAEDLFGKLLCVGVGTWIAVQSLIHIGVTTGLLPNTGIPLPFMSYGVSSLTSNLIGIGYVMHVYASYRTRSIRYKTNDARRFDL